MILQSLHEIFTEASRFVYVPPLEERSLTGPLMGGCFAKRVGGNDIARTGRYKNAVKKNAENERIEVEEWCLKMLEWGENVVVWRAARVGDTTSETTVEFPFPLSVAFCVGELLRSP